MSKLCMIVDLFVDFVDSRRNRLVCTRRGGYTDVSMKTIKANNYLQPPLRHKAPPTDTPIA